MESLLPERNREHGRSLSARSRTESGASSTDVKLHSLGLSNSARSLLLESSQPPSWTGDFSPAYLSQAIPSSSTRVRSPKQTSSSPLPPLSSDTLSANLSQGDAQAECAPLLRVDPAKENSQPEPKPQTVPNPSVTMRSVIHLRPPYGHTTTNSVPQHCCPSAD